MEDYQAKPFAGEWNEDPKNFLGWFLICMGSADDNTKAHQFIYYLKANSDADKWYEELPEEEKGSWASIEKLFHRRWLKEEEISIKESVTSENEPQPTSKSSPDTATGTPPDFGSSHSIPTSATETETTASHNLKIKYTTCAQSPAPFENGENTKFGDKSEIIYEFSTYNTNFFSPNQYVAFSDSRIHSNTITAFEMRSTVANFAQKHRKVENSSHYSKNPLNFTVFSSTRLSSIVSDLLTPSYVTAALETHQLKVDFTPNVEKVEIPPNSTKTTFRALAPSVVEHTDDVSRVHTSLPTSKDVLFQPAATSTTASLSHPQATRDKKAMLSCVIFESQPSTESPVPTTIASALKTRPVTAFL